MIYSMNLNAPWYELVQNGSKIYEGRRISKKTKNILIGDIIEFQHYIDKSLPIIKTEVVDIIMFQTFEDAMIDLPLEQILPIKNITLDQGIDIYINYVSIETQMKDGVYMFKIKKL